VAGLIALALFAAAPFFGTARATTDDDLRAFASRVRAFRTQVKGGELTPKGIDREAKRLIDMKRELVLASEQQTGVYLEPYLDLARIDYGLEGTRRNATRVGRAKRRLQDAITATRELVAKLFGRSDAAAYASSADCLEDLEQAQEELERELRGSDLRPGEIRVRANELVAAKMSCIAAWPPVFGESFAVIYGLLDDIDRALETIADPPEDSAGDVVAALRQALGSTRQLRRQVEEWTAGTPSATPSGTASSRPSPSLSPSAGAMTSPSAPPSVTPSPSQPPTPEESPTGINPHPPNVSAISAVFDSQTHRTTYSVTASDPDNDELTFSWTKSNERECGTFSYSGHNATWNHGEPPCPVENPHPGTINVFVSDGIYTCSAFYEGGSAPGSGPPAECGGNPRP
jgi:hypothetical protein